MIAFAGIDGTSTLDDEAYKVTYLNSFVNRLGRNELVRFIEKPFYLRGPFLNGRDTAERAKEGYRYIKEKWSSGEAKAVFLAGHSRGGAAAVEIAKWLKADDIPVECLILFDAVDRTDTLGTIFNNTPIADTVKMVIHARRNILLTQSRLSFGNCGTTFESAKTPLFQQYFFATHSGVGGVPWTKAVDPLLGIPMLTIWEPGELKASFVTPARDQSGSTQVWNWAEKLIRYAYGECKRRLEQEKPVSKPDYQVTPQPGGSLPPTGGNGKQRIHVVQAGDWLSKIALKYYGDAMKYPVIHKANLQTIGPNPDVIKPGQRLVIP